MILSSEHRVVSGEHIQTPRSQPSSTIHYLLLSTSMHTLRFLRYLLCHQFYIRSDHMREIKMMLHHRADGTFGQNPPHA
jgi:hypothetical protein